MPTRHSHLFYAALYGLTYLVSLGIFIILGRTFRDVIPTALQGWIIGLGLVLILLGPCYYVGKHFITKEKRGLTRKEGGQLALANANLSLILLFAILTASELIQSQGGSTWITLFTSFQTVPAFLMFWVLYCLAVGLVMACILWFAMRGAPQQSEIDTDTFS